MSRSDEDHPPVGRDPDDAASALVVGSRVAVRTRLTEQESAAAAGATSTDTVGELITLEPDHLVVATRRGEVRLDRARVTAAKVIPPRPGRRGAPHRAITIDDLQRIMVAGHHPIERERLGEWLLRAADGWTARANSLLPIGNPGVALPEAVAEARHWYATRGLRFQAQIAGPLGAPAEDHPVADEILRQGGVTTSPTLVMTAAVSEVLLSCATDRLLPAEHYRLETAEAPSAAWLAAAEPKVADNPEIAAAVLSRSPQTAYLGLVHRGITAADELVAVARSPLHDGWAGLFCVHTRPDMRRRGLARALVHAAAERAQRSSIRSMYLQVEADDTAAVALYEGLGFTTHHVYRYIGD